MVDVRASYEYNYTVQAYTLNASPHSGGGYQGYTSNALTPLTGATNRSRARRHRVLAQTGYVAHQVN